LREGGREKRDGVGERWRERDKKDRGRKKERKK
jgi:hypothetical protein